MWGKLTQHIGIWFGLDETERRPMRSSLSMSMLHNSHYAVVRSSKSSDNLHKVNFSNETLHRIDNATLERVTRNEKKAPSKSPPNKKSSIFSLRRGRKQEKKILKSGSNGTPESLVMPRESCDPLTQSWHSTANGNNVMNTNGNGVHTTPVKNIFQFLRPSRSRSNNNPDTVVVNRTATGCPSSSTVADFTHLRRRRPRSAHYDPNTLILPKKDDFPAQDVNDLYHRLEKLGEGSYAVVFKCESKLDGSIVALKEIKLQFQEGLPFTAIREASLLKTLRHANIVCLHDIFHQQSQLTFVFEYMKMDLSKYLESYQNGLDPFQIKLLMYQLLRGLAFCHHRKILHRDLKPQNLLLNENGELKLADFGLARAKSVPSRTYSHEVVTLWYRPPDVLLGSTNYSTSLDMWGVGCIMAELCTGRAIFPGTKDVMDQLDKIFCVRGVPDSQRWPEVLRLPHYNPELFPPYKETPWHKVHSRLANLQNGQELLSMLLQLNPSDRVSASLAMLHPFFSALPTSIHLLQPEQSIFVLPQLQGLKR